MLVPILVLGLCVSCAPPPRASATAESAFDVIELTIPQAHRAIETNLISCEGLTRRYLKRIEAYDQPTGLNAIIRTNPNAIERSRKLDEQFADRRPI